MQPVTKLEDRMKISFILLYRRGKNGIWWVRYPFNGGREHYSLRTTSDAKALAMVKQILYEIAIGIHRPEPELVFDKLWERYKKEAWLEKRESSIRRDRISIKALNMFFGGKPIREENLRAQVRDYRLMRSNGELHLRGAKVKKVSAATVNREVALLKHMTSLATNEWRILKNDPLLKLKMSKEKPRERPISPEEWRSLRVFSHPELRDFLNLSRRTAIRHGVVAHGMLNMKWADVDLENGIIYLPDSKNHCSYKVYMGDTVKRILTRRKKVAASEFVFPGKDGKHRYSFYGLFKKAKDDAGIKNLRIHDLRHQFASDMKSKGADDISLAKIMGLSSTAMLKVYGNPDEAHLRQLMGSKPPKHTLGGPKVAQNEDEDTDK
jgi:integrase